MSEISDRIAIPAGARPVARVLLLDQMNRLLYLHAREESSGREFWVLPGGGLETSESFEEAAIREAREETGIEVELGACLWTRHHIYQWEGREHNQFEVIFLARTEITEINAPEPDDYVFGHRWWRLAELEQSDDHFVPTSIAVLLAPILDGVLPPGPVDCGV